MTINAGVLATGAAPLALARTGGFPWQKSGGTGGGAFGVLTCGTCGSAFDDGLLDVLGSAPDALDEPLDWLGCFGASFIGTP